MIIAIDFDGTIVEHRFPAIGKPLPFAFDALKALQADGHQLVLWTNREDKYLNEAIEFCRTNGVEFYAVNSEYPGASWTGSGVSRKLNADIYIDDKNLGGLLPCGDYVPDYGHHILNSGAVALEDKRAYDIEYLTDALDQEHPFFRFPCSAEGIRQHGSACTYVSYYNFFHFSAPCNDFLLLYTISRRLDSG